MAEDMEMYGPDLVTLVDDEGNEHEFEMVDSMEEDGSRYVALVAAYDDAGEMLQDDGELLVLKAVEEDGEEFLESIEDEAEFTRISDLFMDRLKDEFDFVEGEES